MTDIDHSIEDLERQIDRSGRRSFLLTLLATTVAVMAVLGFAAYSIYSLTETNDELDKTNKQLGEINEQWEETNQQLEKTNQQLKVENGDLRREAEAFDQVKTLLSELLARLSEVEGDSNLNNDQNLEQIVEQTKKQIGNVEDNLEINKQNELDRKNEKDTIRKAIRVVQTATRISAPQGREDEGRNWFRIMYKVKMDKLTNPVSYNGEKFSNNKLIDRVEYRFSERWYNPSIRLGGNRDSDFNYGVRVWGRTVVKVAIFVKGFEEPIIRQKLMSLDQDSIF